MMVQMEVSTTKDLLVDLGTVHATAAVGKQHGHALSVAQHTHTDVYLRAKLR